MRRVGRPPRILTWLGVLVLAADAVLIILLLRMPPPPSPMGRWVGNGRELLLTDSVATLNGQRLAVGGVRGGRICLQTAQGCMTFTFLSDSAVLRDPLRTMIDTGDVIAVLRRP
jgi:hypothetical protein